MRLLRLATLIALLLPLGSFVPSAHADKVKYKSRDREPQVQQRQTPDGQARYKQPPPPPDNRPRDRDHPTKWPPPPPPPQPPSQPPAQPPVVLTDGGCPPPPPPGIWDDRWEPLPPACEPILVDPLPVVDPVSSTLHNEISARMRLLEEQGFAGRVVVGYRGRVNFDLTYGFREIDRYASVSSPCYDIGAVTMSLTASAIRELIKSHRLELGTTLGELFPNAPQDNRRIQVAHLLAHTSGLGNTCAADGETDRNVAVSKLLAQPLAHAPGQSFTFSDDGYVVLAAIIEVASGMRYESYLLDSEVVNWKMHQTVFWDEVGFRLAGVSNPDDRGGAHWGRRGSNGIAPRRVICTRGCQNRRGRRAGGSSSSRARSPIRDWVWAMDGSARIPIPTIPFCGRPEPASSITTQSSPSIPRPYSW